MNRSQKRKMARMSRKDNEIHYKRMMRAQMLTNAAESLTAKELEEVMENKGVMNYIETKLDDNGVPIDGDTKQVKLSNIDVERLRGVLASKIENEKQHLENSK